MLQSAWFKRGVFLLIAYLLYLWSWQSAFGSETTPPATLLSLKGHLAKEELQSVSSALDSISPNQPLVITINSTSGDLMQALEIAKKLYSIKAEKNTKLIVYIDDNAIGPAAIFPLLADEIYTSMFISWGDIPLGNEKILATNLLRNRVLSLIDSHQKNASLLKLLASAMSDPSLVVIEDHGWRLSKEGEEGKFPTVSPNGETLVVNHNQLIELNLVQQVLPLDKFLALYHFAGKELSSQPVSQLSTLEGNPISPKQLEDELRKHIVYKTDAPNTIGHIVIDDRSSGISQATWLYVKSALDHYKKIKPIFVILELNTPGGEVFAAQKISDALKELDTQDNIPVVAYINNWAISAGAMLAYSCRFIAVVKDASMGAAEPVIQDATTGHMETASEKVNSALRADFANRARFFDRDPLIAEAMVDKDLILVKRHGKIIKLDNENQIRSNGTDPDLIISPKGKLLTLDTEQLINYGVADLLVPPTKTPSITDAEQENGKWPAEKMALFHQPFLDKIPQSTVESYRMDWKTRFFAILALPAVSSILFLGLMLGLYVEFTTGGFGIAGTVAVTCLFLIILSSLSLEIGNWLELILLIVGLGIILIELFVLPTFGLLGFIGVIFFLMGLFGMMLPGIGSIGFEFDTKTFNAAGEVFFERLAWLSGTLVVAFILMIIIGRYLTPKISAYSRFVLKGNEQVGYMAVDNPSELPQPGAIGEAATTLRPAGKVIINDVMYDGVSAGAFIDKNDKIVVVRLEGSSIVVSPVSEIEEKKETPT